MQAALTGGAVALAPPSPNNTYGYGRVDALGAYNFLLVACFFPPRPTFTSTPTLTLHHPLPLLRAYSDRDPYTNPRLHEYTCSQSYTDQNWHTPGFQRPNFLILTGNQR